METRNVESGNVSEHLFLLANRVLSIVGAIVFAAIFILVGLIVFYFLLILQPPEAGVGDAANAALALIQSFWTGLLPYLANFIKLVAPVFILLFALGVLYKFLAGEPRAERSPGLFSDLPSVLAVIVIVAICLLPFAGFEVPEVLSNIALVIVGFYFGKRKTEVE